MNAYIMVMGYKKHIIGLLGITTIVFALNSCSNSDNGNSAEITIIDYLVPNNSIYPYAGIPRITIETEGLNSIEDRETKVPAKLQIWGKDAPESDVMELTIKGRGNTSWTTPKKSYKIDFVDKQEILGMPKDCDWVLIPNYADKTLMKNYLAYHLSAKIGANYAPRCEFVELYLNGDYLGVYLLVENIKISKNRVNIPDNSNSYIVEITDNNHESDQLVHSYVIQKVSTGKTFKIHEPHDASPEALSTIEKHLQEFENFLVTVLHGKENKISDWFDMDAGIKHYWIQEFFKNPDAIGFSSVFFSWTKGSVIRMGPVWDFDLALGGHNNDTINKPEDFYIKGAYWHVFLFKDSLMNRNRIDFWMENRDKFASVLSDADSIQAFLEKAAENNSRRWGLPQDDYDESVEELKRWIRKRIDWIDNNILSADSLQ